MSLTWTGSTSIPAGPPAGDSSQESAAQPPAPRQRLVHRWKRIKTGVKNYLLMITPSRPIELQEHYGASVWTHVEMDAKRKTECLCRLCERCNPGKAEHCGTAAAIYKICQERDVAMAITRCPHFSPVPNNQLASWVKK